MSETQTDTIFALSSAPGRAGVSVFRLSGPKSGEALAAITRAALPRPRIAALRPIYNDADETIDQPLVLWFPAPKSFTGEDCAELQVHGSPAVIAETAAALLTLGLRDALPGEFTRRAVENGKMDLTEAEGLADLIDAETSGQRRQAMRQMEGGLREVYEGWRGRLLDAMAQIEGEIDFADEADVPDALSHAAYPILSGLQAEMADMLAGAERGRAIRRGIQIAIIGAPNAGKSTLMNGLAQRDVAITSPEAGTTRDIVEASLRIGHQMATLLDTAGLRETEDAIEAEGVKRAKTRAEDADMRILVHRPSLAGTADEFTPLLSRGDCIYINKSTGYADIAPPNPDVGVIDGDALEGTGLDELLVRLEAQITERFSASGDAGITRARHKDCISRAEDAVSAGISMLGDMPELASENIRTALSALEELAGRADIEQVFDRIFSRFCIGK